MTILGVLVGATTVISGTILVKRSRRKVWYILTITGGLIFLVSLFLLICTLLLTEGIRNQQPTDGESRVESIGNESENSTLSASEEDAIALVERAMDERKESASVILLDGSDIIEGEQCLTLSAGSYSADGQKYTAMFHYAVSDSGSVYYIDVLQGADWNLYKWKKN